MASGTGKTGCKAIRQLEEGRGNIVNRAEDSSYDLLIKEDGAVLHAEVKTAESPTNHYFAINGLAALRRLFEDKQYRLYFCVMNPEVRVLRCNASFLFNIMQWKKNEGAITTLETLGTSIAQVTSAFHMSFDTRVRFHLPQGVGQLIDSCIPLSGDERVQNGIDGVWGLTADNWEGLC